MGFYQWKDSFALGVSEIDGQHKTFLDYLNSCYQDVSSGNKENIDPGLLDNLKSYAAIHFRYEEALMLAGHYPDLDNQVKQHHYFESKIAELEVFEAVGGKRTAESLLTFLRDWLLDHILVQDKRFSLTLKQNSAEKKIGT